MYDNGYIGARANTMQNEFIVANGLEMDKYHQTINSFNHPIRLSVS